MLAYIASTVEQDLASVKDYYYYTGIRKRVLLTYAKSYNLRQKLSTYNFLNIRTIELHGLLWHNFKKYCPRLFVMRMNTRFFKGIFL